VADFEWMADPAFRNEMEAEVVRAAKALGITQYESAIVDALQSYLATNVTRRLTEEILKSEREQRSKVDALHSVDILVEEAARQALAKKRSNITERDLREAYAAKFCQVWPFC